MSEPLYAPNEPITLEWYFIAEDHQCITATPCGIRSLKASHRTFPKIFIQMERFQKVVENPSNGEVYHIEKVRLTVPRHVCEKLKVVIK